jgi:hypothetical protein
MYSPTLSKDQHCSDPFQHRIFDILYNSTTGVDIHKDPNYDSKTRFLFLDSIKIVEPEFFNPQNDLKDAKSSLVRFVFRSVMADHLEIRLIFYTWLILCA